MSVQVSTQRSDPVTKEIRQMFLDVVFVGICGFVSVLGMGANIINISVFIKQGFKDSINISLLGLALADLACVATMFWSTICINPLIADSGQPFATIDFLYLTGSWPHVCFNRVTSFITSFITLERCLCVTVPLKIKTIITAFRTKVIIFSIFAVMFVIFSPTYYVNKLEWRFSDVWNRSRLSLAFTEDRALVETVTFLIHSVILSTFSLVTVLVTSVILIFKLNDKAKWRQTSVPPDRNTLETTSLRDRKVVKMVTLISIIFFVCFLPSTVVFFIMAYNPEFNFGGKYENCFVSVWSVGLLLETVSSSINILVYYRISVKFRETFILMFCGIFQVENA